MVAENRGAGVCGAGSRNMRPTWGEGAVCSCAAMHIHCTRPRETGGNGEKRPGVFTQVIGASPGPGTALKRFAYRRSGVRLPLAPPRKSADRRCDGDSLRGVPVSFWGTVPAADCAVAEPVTSGPLLRSGLPLSDPGAVTRCGASGRGRALVASPAGGPSAPPARAVRTMEDMSRKSGMGVSCRHGKALPSPKSTKLTLLLIGSSGSSPKVENGGRVWLHRVYDRGVRIARSDDMDDAESTSPGRVRVPGPTGRPL